MLLIAPIFVGAVYPQIAQARLGESSASIAADQRILSAKKKAIQTFSAYTIHEIKSETITIRQYISPSDVVFGIAWTGMTQPDLTELLGTYADEYKKTSQKRRRQPGRRFFRAATDDLVVEKWGHQCRMCGRAYVPALIPDVVNTDEIQ